MALYICFDDSKVDPTYASADNAYIVDSDYSGEDNPCVNDVKNVAPVIPITVGELKAFASMMGWGLEFDNQGQVVLYTNVHEPIND